MVCRFQLTYDENKDTLDLKIIPTKITGFSLKPGIFEITDINKPIEYNLADNVKVSITVEAIRMKSNSNNIQTSIFTNKSFSIEF